MNKGSKTYLVIGSSNFLYRLGVKTILSVIGVESEVIETTDYEQFKSYITDEDVLFFVLFQDLIATPLDDTIDEIYHAAPDKRFMLIGEDLNCKLPNISVINQLDSQKSFFDEFQQLFIETTPVVPKENSILTEREIDVLRQVALGLSNKEMADKLFISTNTVITHRKNITDKLGIKTIPGLTVYAIMNGIIIPDEVKY